jgi:hypothetical protein
LKVFVALVIGALFAVYLNLTPVIPDNKAFFRSYTIDEETYTPYYTVKNIEELNWTYYNSLYFSINEPEEGECDKTPRTATKVENLRLFGNTGLWWVRTEGEESQVFDPNEGEELVTPYYMKIATQSSSEAAARGTLELKYDGAEFSIVFNNLKSWYCCTTHEPDEDGIYRHKGDNSAKIGDELPSGYVLGIASSDTTVVFNTPSGRSVSAEEFYTALAKEIDEVE